MSNPLFCVKCGGELKLGSDGYKCLNCDKMYPLSKDNSQKKDFFKEF